MPLTFFKPAVSAIRSRQTTAFQGAETLAQPEADGECSCTIRLWQFWSCRNTGHKQSARKGEQEWVRFSRTGLLPKNLRLVLELLVGCVMILRSEKRWLIGKETPGIWKSPLRSRLKRYGVETSSCFRPSPSGNSKKTSSVDSQTVLRLLNPFCIRCVFKSRLGCFELFYE